MAISSPINFIETILSKSKVPWMYCKTLLNFLRSSKVVLLGMGVSLDFHAMTQPIVSLMNLYEKFRFFFDHIYAFEVTSKDPKDVYDN